jgi:uracil-DNA glycosylase
MLHLIEPSWHHRLQQETQKDYFVSLCSFLDEEKQSGYNIYPPEHLVFNAFAHTPFNDVKVVIL